MYDLGQLTLPVCLSFLLVCKMGTVICPLLGADKVKWVVIYRVAAVAALDQEAGSLLRLPQEHKNDHSICMVL